MTDKERILTLLVKRIYQRALYSPDAIRHWREIQPGLLDERKKLKAGDLVVASTSIEPNDFMVGYIHTPPNHEGTAMIREIGSDRLCEYGNESFMLIDKDLLGEEILEGTQYITRQKVRKAFARAEHSYTLRYAGVEFDGKTCKVMGRKVFSDEILICFEFTFNSKTTINSIIDRINREYARHLQEVKTANET